MSASEQSFGGRAGDAVLRAVSPAALITGILLAVVLGAAFYVSVRLGIERAAPVLGAVIVAGFLAHAAVDAFDARWAGGRGVAFAELAPVALRYLALQSLLVVPVLFVGWRPEVLGSRTPLIAFLVVGLYVACVFLAPPFFLIVSVAAKSLRDIATPAHWTRAFGGRGSDVFLIFVLYTGAMISVLVLCAPLVAASMLVHPRAPYVSGIFAALFAVGTSVLLLGQLCGEFARPLRTDEPRMKIIAQAPPPAPVAAAPSTARKLPLFDAGKRVAQILAGSGGEAVLAAVQLEGLRREYAPNPAVLHALTLSYAQQGKREDSLAVAREAIPLCVRSGSTILAAELVAAFREEMAAVGVTTEQAVPFADALRSAKKTALAASLYSTLLAVRPASPRAVKGALQVAQDMVAAGEAQAALPLFDMLMECSAGTPLHDFVASGRENALQQIR